MGRVGHLFKRQVNPRIFIRASDVLRGPCGACNANASCRRSSATRTLRMHAAGNNASVCQHERLLSMMGPTLHEASRCAAQNLLVIRWPIAHSQWQPGLASQSASIKPVHSGILTSRGGTNTTHFTGRFSHSADSLQLPLSISRPKALQTYPVISPPGGFPCIFLSDR